jgi:hypothetical protein
MRFIQGARTILKDETKTLADLGIESETKLKVVIQMMAVTVLYMCVCACVYFLSIFFFFSQKKGATKERQS